MFSRLLGYDLLYKQGESTGFMSDHLHREVISTAGSQARVSTDYGPFPKGKLEAADLFQRLRACLYAEMGAKPSQQDSRELSLSHFIC